MFFLRCLVFSLFRPFLRVLKCVWRRKTATVQTFFPSSVSQLPLLFVGDHQALSGRLGDDLLPERPGFTSNLIKHHQQLDPPSVILRAPLWAHTEENYTDL